MQQAFSQTKSLMLLFDYLVNCHVWVVDEAIHWGWAHYQKPFWDNLILLCGTTHVQHRQEMIQMKVRCCVCLHLAANSCPVRAIISCSPTSVYSWLIQFCTTGCPQILFVARWGNTTFTNSVAKFSLLSFSLLGKSSCMLNTCKMALENKVIILSALYVTFEKNKKVI